MSSQGGLHYFYSAVVCPKGAKLKEIRYDQLEDADLETGVTYCWGPEKNLKSEPISKLLGLGNVGGFRWKGRMENVPYVVITSNSSKSEWPDHYQSEKGLLTYYGDNHDGFDHLSTPGNAMLNLCNERLQKGLRNLVPPFLYFKKSDYARGLVFLGAFHPDVSNDPDDSWLQLIIRSNSRQFSNYKARFRQTSDLIITRDKLQNSKSGLGRQLAHYSDWIDGV